MEHSGPERSFSSEERSRLEHEIIEISEIERRRMGREFHDGLGQKLTGVSLVASILAEKLERKGLPEAEDARRLLRMVQDAVRDARNLARGLFPMAIREKGLEKALGDLLSQVRETAGIETNLRVLDWSPVTDLAVATHVFRIVQEAVNNAVKHASCSVISVTLSMNGSAHHVLVEDNGRGLEEVESAEAGMGLHLMRYRAKMLGGQVSVANRPEGGCVVALGFTSAQGT